MKQLSRKKKILFSLAALFLTVVSAMVVAEGAVRVFYPQKITPRFVETAPWGIRRISANVNGMHKTAEYSYRYHSNSQGFRGTREYAIVPPEDCLRIVAQGDSVTLGLGVKDDETYSHVLEEMLRQDGIPAEVINAGVPGFGTAEELIQFHEVVEEYKPDLVILGFFYNDYMNNAICGLFTVEDGALRRTESNFVPGIYVRDRLNKVPGYSLLSQHSHLVTLLRDIVSHRIMGRLEKKTGFRDPRAKQGDGQNEAAAANQTTLLTKLLLEKYALDVTATGAQLFIVDLADKSWVSCFPADVNHNGKTRILCTYDAFKRARDEGRAPFYPVDGHPTAEGHKAIAACIYEALQHEWASGALSHKR